MRRDFTRLLPELRAFARFLTRDQAAADDLVQDTVVRALASQHSFEPGTNLKAWMFTIQRNAFYEQARRRQRERRVMDEQRPEAVSEPPQAIGRARVSDLQRLLWTLPPLLREALVLVGAQELSHEQAAAICGVPVGTMKARVSRARAQLAQAVRVADGERQEGDAAPD
ncbi:sigma-70 family RNA polymerase sigma factor [Rhizosaccharibacter radicis]|uniref:Sigma-70 family RNA polymerase sigma factor n=1 Tax=Rhizosaccharibacter radicis TaxID=2782605 RepID=A0ABT1VY91_9PROT|nr:sigma-70 family RNA polymerase sigma factor [Acetobacteraceae bacterium KSS12]